MHSLELSPRLCALSTLANVVLLPLCALGRAGTAVPPGSAAVGKVLSPGPGDECPAVPWNEQSVCLSFGMLGESSHHSHCFPQLVTWTNHTHCQTLCSLHFELLKSL